MGLADLHTHTSLTDGMMDVGALLAHIQEHTDIDVLAVTDHDDITAGLMARELARQQGYRFEVIVGEEVTTREGHLIGLFLERQVPRLQSLEFSLRAIHEQGGLAVIPHPLSWLTFSLGRRSIRRVATSSTPGVHFDAVETANPSLAAQVVLPKVLELNQELGLPPIGASDAHFLQALGLGQTRFPGATAEDLRRAIRDKTTEAESRKMDLRSIGVGNLAKQQVQALVIHPARSVAAYVARGLVPRREGPGT